MHSAKIYVIWTTYGTTKNIQKNVGIDTKIKVIERDYEYNESMRETCLKSYTNIILKKWKSHVRLKIKDN